MIIEDTKIISGNIEDFIDVPDGINRLRKAILTLAVSGKLVPQDPKEGTSEALYQKILEVRSIEAKKTRKKLTIMPSITEKEIPFEIPKSWKWVRLGNVAELIYGKGLDKKDRTISGKYIAYGANGLKAKTNIFNCNVDGIIIGRKGTAGAVNVVHGPFYATDVTYFIPKDQFGAFELRFLELLLLSMSLPLLAKGIKPGLNRNDVYKIVIGLPTINEQKRIVEKVDELMKIVDELERKKSERDAVRSKLAISAFLSLGKNDTDIALKHMSELVRDLDDVKQLEKCILTLAVTGKLVSQKSTKEQSLDLLKKIDEERSTISFTDHRVKSSQTSYILSENIWKIPDNWIWRSLTDIALFVDYRGKTPVKMDSGVRLITAKNIRKGFISKEPSEYISKESYINWMTRGIPKIGDVLFTTEAPMGNVSVVNINEQFALAQRVINFSLFGGMNPYYLMLYLSSEYFQKILDIAATGLTAKGIKSSRLKLLPVAIPPIEEQKRIVEKVDELMVLAKRLKLIMKEH